jgi:hypothetical protein
VKVLALLRRNRVAAQVIKSHSKQTIRCNFAERTRLAATSVRDGDPPSPDNAHPRQERKVPPYGALVWWARSRKSLLG